MSHVWLPTLDQQVSLIHFSDFTEHCDPLLAALTHSVDDHVQDGA